MKYSIIDKLTLKPIATFEAYGYVVQFLAVHNCPVDWYIVLKYGNPVDMSVLNSRIQCVRSCLVK